MTIRVARLPAELNWSPRGTAVVIDVLRATTVITTALRAGAADVVVCGEIDEAVRLAETTEPRPLLCGERACRPIPGFDLGNSPSEYTPSRMAGRRLIMTTTNGTRAVLAARGFPRILAASFNNLAAVVARLSCHDEVSIICAGTDGETTEEDDLLAGAIVDSLLAVERLGGDDGVGNDRDPRRDESGLGTAASAVLRAWRDYLASGQALADRLAESTGGRNLIAQGYQRDIDVCAELDSTTAIGIIDAAGPLNFRLLTPPRHA